MAAAIPPAAMAAAVPPPPPVFTVHDAMIMCGVDNVAQFNGETPAERFANDLFGNDFIACMDKSMDELNQDFKSYSDLTQAQGQIRISPGTKRNIRSFVHWVRDETRLGRNPNFIAFPVAMAPQLLRRFKTHTQFVTNSKTISEAAKPEKFANDTKWEDWSVTFLGYLRALPGRDGVPLKYICRSNDQPDPTPHQDFLDDYVAMAPLTGEAFSIDAATVHTLLMNFITGNQVAESKVQINQSRNNGRLDFMALRDHYEGIGILAVDIQKAETTIRNLFYAGEKRPHMWWDEFERQLTDAFTTYDKREGRIVYSNNMKLRMLVDKISEDFMKEVKAGLSIELSKQQMTMTYETALAAFRNEVNRQHPPQMSQNTRVRRNIREMNQGGRFGGRGRGRGRFGGRGRGGRGIKRTRTDSTFITLTDGTKVEYHPSFNFPPHIYKKMKQEDVDRLRAQRADYKKNKSQSRQVQELQQQLAETQSVVQQLSQSVSVAGQSQPNIPTNVSVGQHTQISRMTTGTMFGGRNEQAMRRKNNNNDNHSVGAVITTRKIGSIHADHPQPSANTKAYNECDTNADTSCLGTNFTIINYTNRTADVYAYQKDYKPLEGVPIVSGATAWDDPTTQQTYILVVHEALYYGTRLDHSLFNPNQFRSYGLGFWDNPYDKERGLEIEINDDITIPMYSSGTKVLFQSRVPTAHELNTCPHINLTSQEEWNPKQVQLGEVNIHESAQRNPQYRIS